MKKRYYLVLYLVSLVFYLGISLFQKTPGYMDASYYYATGQQIAEGKGAVEPFIWNYLGNPEKIPNPAFSYWMPLPALIAALGMKLSGIQQFSSARLFFILLASCIPLITVYLTSKFTNNRASFLLAIVFSLFSGAYLPYLSITETFTPYFFLGGLFFILAMGLHTAKWKIPFTVVVFFLGITTGLMHLTRADGVLWLLGGGLYLWMISRRTGKRKELTKSWLIYFLGYLTVMSGWFVHNMLLHGVLFPSGSNLSLWFINYNDLFTYPATKLTIKYFIKSGLSGILKTRGNAGLYNLEDLVGVVGSIVLFPFIVVGIWKTRNRQLTQYAIIMTVLIFVMMTLIFPFAGSRGGFFHSMSSLQIYMWVMGVIGMDAVILWTVKHFKWVEEKARTMIMVLISFSLIVISCLGYYQKVQPSTVNTSGWDKEYEKYSGLDRYIQENFERKDYSVMINDSPGYFVSSGKTAIQLPNASISDTKVLLKKFNIDYLIVDKNVPDSLNELYSQPGNQSGLKLIDQFDDYYIYNLDQ